MDNLGKKIKELRENNKLSQLKLSERLGISRVSVSQLENGDRKACSKEIVKLAGIFNISTDYLLGLEKEPEVKLEEPIASYAVKQDIRISVPSIKKNKFTEVLLYLLEKTAGKPNIGETVIYKLLYFADCNYYELYEEQMTGATYRKLQYGPVPIEFTKIVENMEQEKKLRIIKDNYYDYLQKRYIPLVKTDLSKLKASEKDILDKVIEQYSDWSAAKLSEYSHGDMPWKATKSGDIIDYELVFYRTPPYSVRNYEGE
jgi:transcriptional regulator with XRE-family HTH domain